MMHKAVARHTIESIEAILLAVPLAHRDINLVAVKKGSSLYAILVRIRTADGILGECYTSALGTDPGAVTQFIDQELAPLLVGRNACAIEACWDTMFSRTRPAYWSRAIAMRALACVDCALWDVVGKITGLPLHKLWGGFRESLPVVVMDSAWHVDENSTAFGKRIEAMRKAGLGGCKLKVGMNSPLGPRGDAERMKIARDAAGADFLLFADANQGWTPVEAMQFSKRVEELQLRWLEEPCGWNDDKRALAQVRATGHISIAAGQMEIAAEGCRDMMAAAAIDFCNFDAQRGGGATAWRRIAATADCYGIGVVHHQGPQLGGHLAASVRNGTHLEVYDAALDPFYYEMVLNRPSFNSGWSSLPDEPGWGWQLDERFITRYRMN